MGRRVNGGSIVRALDALSAISGNLGVPGGGASFYFKRRKTFDHSFIQGIDGAPRSILEPLFGPEMLAIRIRRFARCGSPPGNPVAMLPESATVDRALRSREFVCVVDSWPNDTTRAATLVLPRRRCSRATICSAATGTTGSAYRARWFLPHPT